jgi:cytochrome c oxidase cbb3-type subunit 2
LPTAIWHFQHLYNPLATSPGSIMPPFPFLFEKRTLRPGEPTPKDAVALSKGILAANECLVPTERARVLVAYLLAMKHQVPLPEAR